MILYTICYLRLGFGWVPIHTTLYKTEAYQYLDALAPHYPMSMILEEYNEMYI